MHWYTKNGEACHFMEKKDGTGQRATTLRDARSMSLLPSVTGILDQLNKPALNNWSIKQVLQSAYDTCWHFPEPVLKTLNLEEFCSKIKEDAFKDSTEAREVGGEIHAAIEQVYLGNTPELHSETAYKAAHAISDYCGSTTLTPEKTVVGEGYGGMVDLHDDDWCIDHKTKDITDKQWEDYQAGKNPRLAYPEMCMQLSAYDVALGSDGFPEHTHRRCINVFIDRKIPGRVIIHEWTTDEIEMAYKKFMLLVVFWQLDKNYYPGEA